MTILKDLFIFCAAAMTTLSALGQNLEKDCSVKVQPQGATNMVKIRRDDGYTLQTIHLQDPNVTALCGDKKTPSRLISVIEQIEGMQPDSGTIFATDTYEIQKSCDYPDLSPYYDKPQSHSYQKLVGNDSVWVNATYKIAKGCSPRLEDVYGTMYLVDPNDPLNIDKRYAFDWTSEHCMGNKKTVELRILFTEMTPKHGLQRMAVMMNDGKVVGQGQLLSNGTIDQVKGRYASMKAEQDQSYTLGETTLLGCGGPELR